MITQTQLVSCKTADFTDSLNSTLAYLAEIGAVVKDIKYTIFPMSDVHSALVIYEVETI